MDLITKNSYEKFPIWADFGNDIAPNETVDSQVVTCLNSDTGDDVTSTVIASVSIPTASSMVKMVIQNGIDKDIYTATIIAVTSLGNTFKKRVEIRIDDDHQDMFTKDADESFSVLVDFVNELESGDSISSYMAKVYDLDGVEFTSTLISTDLLITPRVYVKVQGGTDHQQYIISVRVLTVIGYKYSRTILMVVGDDLDVSW